MSSIYRRGKKLYVGFKGADGLWHYGATGLDVGKEKEAQKFLTKLERRVSAGEDLKEGEAGEITVARFAKKWLEERKSLVPSEWKNDQTRLERHVLRVIGKLPIASVRPRHIIDLIKGLRSAGKLAPKTIYNVYSTVKALFRDAHMADLIDATPCILTKYQLGENVDKDPEFRDRARFSREEFDKLLFDPRLPLEHRVRYALMGLGALRAGETIGIKWRLYETDKKPLGRLMVRFSYARPYAKKHKTRDMPVHPVLAALLVEWKEHGFYETFGRTPEPDDLIIPCYLKQPGRRGRHGGELVYGMLTRSILWKDCDRDLKLLGLRPRRVHDLRRTGISLYQDDGAVKDILNWGTHGRPRARTIDDYTTLEWQTLCTEIAKLRISLFAKDPIGVAKDGTEVPENTEALTTVLLQSLPTIRYLKQKWVEAPGVEGRGGALSVISSATGANGFRQVSSRPPRATATESNG